MATTVAAIISTSKVGSMRKSMANNAYKLQSFPISSYWPYLGDNWKCSQDCHGWLRTPSLKTYKWAPGGSGNFFLNNKERDRHYLGK